MIMEKKIMDLEQARIFVQNNIYKIDSANMLRRCVDGRYDGTDSLPAIATPGGDAGYVMAGLAAVNSLGLSVNPELVIKATQQACGGVSKFQFHTDEHAEHDQADTGMGCGHLKQARQDPESYGVTKEQMEFLFAELPRLIQDGAYQEILKGDHQEQMTLVIDSSNYSIKPNRVNEAGELEEAFVYQMTLDKVGLEKLSAEFFDILAKQNITVEKDVLQKAIMDASDNQRAETLKRLSQGLPRYLVKITESGESTVSEL